jgi:glycosyltransferase involved in cell wall biosynthesis
MDSPTKRKILFVITKSNWGGAQRYVYDLATNLPKEQFEVKVAYGGTGEVGAQRGMLSINLQTHGIKGIFLSGFMRDVSFSRDILAFRELKNIFKTEKPNVVHLNSSKAGGIGALAARFSRVKNIIFTVHGWPFLEAQSTPVKASMWFFSWVTALLCHKVICISDFDLKIAKRMPFVGPKAVLIHNGIGPISFGDGDLIRGAFPSGAHITGTVGELTRNKNQITLINQAKNDQRMYVAIVGSGEDWTMLEETIKKDSLEQRVKLFGFLPVEKVMKGFDVFALPSLKEGLPYVLLEAKAAGLPIEANRVGGVGEILDAKDMSEFSLEQMVQKTAALYR